MSGAGRTEAARISLAGGAEWGMRAVCEAAGGRFGSGVAQGLVFAPLAEVSGGGRMEAAEAASLANGGGRNAMSSWLGRKREWKKEEKSSLRF